MYISNIRIENYRSFYGVFSLELKPFTLVLGENNIGKSNLLDSIALVLSQDITMFKKRVLDTEDINYRTRMEFKEKVLGMIDKNIEDEDLDIFPIVNISLIIDDMNDEQLAVVGDWHFEETLSKVKLTYTFKPRSGFNKKEWIKNQLEKLQQIKESSRSDIDLFKYIDFPISEYEYIVFGGDLTSNKCDNYYLKMLKVEILDALRDAKRELIANGDSKLLFKILDNGENKDYLEVKKILDSLDEGIKENIRIKELKDEINNYLKKISLYNENDKINFSFSSPEIKDIIKKLSLMYGDDPISIERNGLGKNNLLFISLLMSHLNNENNNIPTVFRVIGIEEPEAHLHPHIQTHLVRNIFNDLNDKIEKGIKDTQVIITTHSTHISSSTNLDNIVVLYNENGLVKNHYIGQGLVGEKEKYKKYLRKYLDATNSKMFFARKLILVEGIAEQILVPQFFRYTYGITLESIGCNVVNVNGVAFKNFLEIVKNGYFIKCGVITDKDEGTAVENRSTNLKEEYNSNVILIEDNQFTLEKEIIYNNKKYDEKNILLDIFKSMKPRLCKTYEDKWNKEIDTGVYFEKIKDEKSEFAFLLEEKIQEQLRLKEEGKEYYDFKVPQYILNIFNFIKE